MIKKVGGSTPVKVAMQRDDEGWWIPAEQLPEDGIGKFDYGFVLDDSDTVVRIRLYCRRWTGRRRC